MKQHLTAYITLIALATLMLTAAPLRAETPAAAPSLYDRLGGVYAIAAAWTTSSSACVTYGVKSVSLLAIKD